MSLDSHSSEELESLKIIRFRLQLNVKDSISSSPIAPSYIGQSEAPSPLQAISMKGINLPGKTRPLLPDSACLIRLLDPGDGSPTVQHRSIFEPQRFLRTCPISSIY